MEPWCLTLAIGIQLNTDQWRGIMGNWDDGKLARAWVRGRSMCERVGQQHAKKQYVLVPWLQPPSPQLALVQQQGESRAPTPPQVTATPRVPPWCVLSRGLGHLSPAIPDLAVCEMRLAVRTCGGCVHAGRETGRETEWAWIRLMCRVFNGPGPLNIFWAKGDTAAGLLALLL